MWWLPACGMGDQPGTHTYEGVDNSRHRGNGIVVFNDGHAEARKSRDINPPSDPISAGARGLINSEYWDPLNRAQR